MVAYSHSQFKHIFKLYTPAICRGFTEDEITILYDFLCAFGFMPQTIEREFVENIIGNAKTYDSRQELVHKNKSFWTAKNLSTEELSKIARCSGLYILWFLAPEKVHLSCTVINVRKLISLIYNEYADEELSEENALE